MGIPFRVAFLSGLAEPVGALKAALFYISSRTSSPPRGFAGGVMVFITLDELIPAARDTHHHFTAIGIITGAIFVFCSQGFLERAVL